MKIPFPIALAAVVVIAGAVGWGLAHGLSGGGSHSTRMAPRASAQAPAPLPPGWSYIAVPQGHKIPIHRRPRKGSIRVILRSPTAIGSAVALLVRRAGPRWVQTYLPFRPNGSMGWVSTHAIRLLTTAWSVSVQLRSHRLLLARGGRVVRNFAIGVGRAVTPTPTGTYFITELLKQPDPKGLYGPYAFGLSAYSGVLKHFGRGGNGQIGIHGTNAPQRIGTDVSHGCIRLHNRDILWLIKRLPLGTPVMISHT